MKTSLFLTGRLTLAALLIGMLLTSCSALTPPPTNRFAHRRPATTARIAVQTLSARITQDALAHPSATPTLEPTATATLTPTITPVPATPTLATPPTSTATLPPPISAQALYAATYPENKTVYIPNEKFGLALGFKNTGSITWEAGTYLKLVSFQGEITVQQDAVSLGSPVAPGDKVEINLWAFGSEMLGEHVWTFQLYTPSGGAIPGGVISFYYKSV